MKKSLSLEAQVRENTGTKEAVRLRAAGSLRRWLRPQANTDGDHPGAHAFAEGVHHGHRLLDITIDGKSERW